jgi:sugar phosphate isomerase/epimerase
MIAKMENMDVNTSSGPTLPDASPPRRRRWLRTLNVTDAPSHTDDPHCGSIGHVMSFPESCRLAEKYGFDAVNADRTYVREEGPPNAAAMMQRHNIQPGAFAFSAAFNGCYSDAEFEQSLTHFETDLAACREAGFTCCVGYVQPSSNRLDYYEHFALLSQRLKRIKPFLEAYDVRLGLEFIGPTTMRVQRKFDFIHTMDGLRSLIAAACAQNCVGLKLDALHWYTSGAGLLNIEKLSREEVVYVEINDGLKGDYNRFTLPEFQRELPSATGIINIVGMLQKLDDMGFQGPVVVEPWNTPLREMGPETAVKTVKRALDSCLDRAGINDR